MYYEKGTVVETATGNKVSRRDTHLFGSTNIVLSGKSIIMDGCILRGDLNSIRIGKYCVIGEKSIIRPSYKAFSKGFTYFPIHVGDYVFIENNCVIMASQIGSYVHIGRNSIIGRNVVLKDCVQILPDSVVPQDAIIPPFSIVGGNPATVVGELPSMTQDLMIQANKSFYENFISSAKKFL